MSYTSKTLLSRPANKGDGLGALDISTPLALGGILLIGALVFVMRRK